MKRMRPLVLSTDFILGINGQLMFHNGASEDPEIGTVEDWYLINTVFFGHPIHVHLIQYEFIQEYTLKLVEGEGRCAFYQVDFYMLNDLDCPFIDGFDYSS